MPASRRLGIPAACLAVAVVALGCLPPSGLAAPAQNVPRIQWLPCDPALVTEKDNEFDGRLSCARFRAPLDHVQPDGRTIEVGAVRMAAADFDHREGVLFVNIGGPGGHPGRLVSELTAAFQSWDRDDPVHGLQRRLIERYDIIGVIPRGLPGGWTLDCTNDVTTTHAFLPTHRDDANWQRLVNDARAVASACTRTPESRYVSTEQHVHDMDYVRRAIGEERIHIYGTSYGGRVGAWYAAMYPDHVGNMLLDSSIVFPASFMKATYASMDARKKHFEAHVLAPLLASPARFGQQADLDALRWAPHALHPAVRPYWYGMLDTPERLAAALTMSRWLDAQGWHGWTALGLQLTRTPLTSDLVMDARLQSAAWDLLAPIQHEAAQLTSQKPEADTPYENSVYLAVLCNDEASWGNERQIRAHADNDAYNYPIESGAHTFAQLACVNWGARTARQPALDTLANGRPFLMIHAEDDVITPIEGPRNFTMARYPNAHLIAVTGTDMHGLLGQSETPCIEHDALRFLMDGGLPAGPSRESSCALVGAGNHPAYYEY